MAEKDEEDYKNNNICGFCEKNIESEKVRNHCHLTGKYRGPAHNTCNVNVTKIKVILSLLYFTILVIMIVICSSRN